MKSIGVIGLDLRRALNESRGFVSAEDISAAIWQASNTVFGTYTGHVAHYRPGQPLPERAYGLNDRIDTALLPFVKAQAYARNAAGSVLPLNSDGTLAFPVAVDSNNVPTVENSFQHPTALYIPGARRVSEVNDNAVQDRAANSINAPTATFPTRSIVPGGWRILPTTITSLTLQYLGAPPRPVFAEIEDPDNAAEMIYDDDTSVDIGWLDVTAINEIKAHATRILAGEVKDAQAAQLATQTAQMGA